MVLLNLFAYYTYACNACGCGVGTGYAAGGHQSGTFLGMSYAYRGFHTQPLLGISSTEQFQRMELMGTWQLHELLQVRVNIPYMSVEQILGEESIKNSGLSDISAVMFLSIGQLISNELPYSFYLGGGIKMPTGEYLAIQNGLWLNPNLQVGRGSWDFPLYLSLDRKWKVLNLTLDMSYTLNGENKLKYKFGNQWQGSLRAYKNLSQNQLSKIIDLGGFMEHYAYNQEGGIRLLETQGTLVGVQGGFTLENERFRLGTFARLPVWQSLFQGQVNAKPTIQVSLTARLAQ